MCPSHASAAESCGVLRSRSPSAPAVGTIESSPIPVVRPDRQDDSTALLELSVAPTPLLLKARAGGGRICL